MVKTLGLVDIMKEISRLVQISEISLTYVCTYVPVYTLVTTSSTCTSSQDCSISDSGCLALTNLDWTFEDVYLTCIATNDSCTDVTFTSIFLQCKCSCQNTIGSTRCTLPIMSIVCYMSCLPAPCFYLQVPSIGPIV